MIQELKRSELKRVSEYDLEYWKTGKYTGVDYKYNGEPFTGFSVGGYYDNENGKIAYESLMYCATTVLFNEFSEVGDKTDGGFVAVKSLYNECARVIGIDEIDLEY